MELSIEAASDDTGVALSVDGVAALLATWVTQQNHSVELLPNIDRLLHEAGRTKDDVEAVFVDVGPGGYAGLRVGVSIAKALAHGLGVSIAGVGRLELDAWGVVAEAAGRRIYDRTELRVDDTVEVQVTVTLNEPGRAEWALIDLGIPPGFAVKAEDLAALVTRYEDVPEDYEFPTVERFEMTGRQVLVYIGGLSFEHPLSFSYRLQAKFPLIAKAPASRAYDYYNPEKSGFEAPVELTVER